MKNDLLLKAAITLVTILKGTLAFIALGGGAKVSYLDNVGQP